VTSPDTEAAASLLRYITRWCSKGGDGFVTFASADPLGGVLFGSSGKFRILSFLFGVFGPKRATEDTNAKTTRRHAKTTRRQQEALDGYADEWPLGQDSA
jgi:hypothetical protein